MVLTLLAAVALQAKDTKMAPETPSESIWVYANASTPGDGTYLRAWGVEGKACAPENEDAGQFSYSYLKWDLTGVSHVQNATAVHLELMNTPDPGFSAEGSKQHPIEVRPLVGEFDTKKWSFEMSLKIRPKGDVKSILGKGSATKITGGEPVRFSVDLDSKKFTELLNAAIDSPSHALYLALTSTLDPATDGRSCIYKFYGQNESNKLLRPRLVYTASQNGPSRTLIR